MNFLNFNQTGGFPLSTNILDAMQNAYTLFNKLGSLAGNFAIVSGCEVAGNNVADGVVYINGEILEFRGGGVSANVIVREDTESRVFEDGGTKTVIRKRYAAFGTSTPDQTYAWASFKRVFPTTEIAGFKKSLEDRIKALEDKPSPVPIGLIAVWNRPADVPIPAGWRECTDLRGRVPAGWDPDDADFNQIGGALGEKTHTLTEAELPELSGKIRTLVPKSGYDANTTGITNYTNRGTAYVEGNKSVWDHVDANINFGNNQPHNNIQPTRIVRFIEYVG